MPHTVVDLFSGAGGMSCGFDRHPAFAVVGAVDAFASPSLANLYRHVGDAVPPMLAHQLATLVHWILGAERPAPEQMVLPGCSLRPEDILEN